MITVVVTRFREDVGWAREVLGRGARLVICNKGDPETIPADLLPYTVDLPNIGRDGHTVLRYLVQHYDTLDDEETLVFLQGHPFDHLRDTSSTFEALWARLLPVGETGFSLNLLDSARWGDCAALPSFRIRSYRDEEVTSTAVAETYGQWFERVVGRPLPPACRWVWEGMQFSVSGRLVKARPKALLERMLHEVSFDTNPEAGHFVERALSVVFAEEWIVSQGLPVWPPGYMV